MPDSGLAGMEICRPIALLPTGDTVYTCTTSNTSAIIPVGKASFGSVHVISSAGTKLIAYAAEDTTAASFEAVKSEGVAVEITTGAAGWYELPSACLSVPFLQLRSDSGSPTIRVYLKG